MVAKAKLLGGFFFITVVLIIVILLIVHFSSPWLKVRKRKEGESNVAWSKRIYSVMRGRETSETGINHNADLLGSLTELTKETATQQCGNPCYWGGQPGAPGCKCTDPTSSQSGPAGVKGWGLF